jgi:hypothetical protein
MDKHSNFLTLAEQVRQGEPGAAARLRQELEPRLVVIVGRALQSQTKALPLTGWIRGQASQVLRLVGRRPEDPAWLITQVAKRICEWLVDRLRAGTCSPELLETVCA